MDLAESHKGRRQNILHDSRNLVGGGHGLWAVSPEVCYGVVSGACRSVKENHTVAIAERVSTLISLCSELRSAYL